MWVPILFLVLGLILLYFGAEWLVKGGAALAIRVGLTPLVVGLTVIAFGTSSPEAVVSVNASLAGEGSISLGNVIGSNICNIGLILGICALVTPLTTAVQVIRREIPLLIAVTLGMCLIVWDGTISRIEGVILLCGLLAYAWSTVASARREQAKKASEDYNGQVQPTLGRARSLGLLMVGLVLLLAGADMFVEGAVELAHHWQIPDVIIGLTVVAIGTSLPELAASLVAACKGEGDVAIGNVVGSCQFNIMGILGLAAVIRPVDASGLNKIDLGVVVLMSAALLPLIRSGGRITRWEGLGLLLGYLAYTGWLIVQTMS